MKSNLSLFVCCLVLSMPFASIAAYDSPESTGVSCEQEAMEQELSDEETEQYIAECEQRASMPVEVEQVDPEAVHEDEPATYEQES